MSLLVSLELNRSQFQLSVQTALSAKGVTAIYGHSGAGKTTLLRWIAGLEKSLPGHITFNDTIWQDENTFIAPQHRQIAYVFQEPRLFPHLTVRGNLNYAFKRRFNNQGPNIAQVSKWFELNDLLDSPCPQLSGGEQQRVAIARALLSSPELLLMDEPLGSLDSLSKQRILNHLEQLHQHLPVPILYVSHDITEVSRLAEQLLLLENGTITAQGSLLKLSSRLDLSLSHEENAASILEATIQHHDDDYQLTQLLIDHQLPLLLTRNNGAINQTVRVRIPARDVSITLQRPTQSSILNIIPATISDIEHNHDAHTLVRLKVANQYLLVRLTRKSLEHLALEAGQQVYAQIKTVALLSNQQTP